MLQERKPDGRPALLDDAAVDRLVGLLDHMVVEADGRYEVTVDMLRRRARCAAGVRTITRALHQRRVFFRKLREKPVLTADDVKARKRFAAKFYSKAAAWWTAHVDMHIDVKHFPVYVNGRARAHAAREGVRGAYRTPGQGLERPYLKHGKKYTYNTGARGVMVLAGVGHGRFLVWEGVGVWNRCGDVAAEMYSGPIKSALERVRPTKRRFVVLEDNDLAGFKSN